MMNITIKNVGPIKECNIDLSKNLIVLTGPNNSGKTYAAYIIYGLLKTRYRVTAITEFREMILKLLKDRNVEFDFIKLFKDIQNGFSKEIAQKCIDELPNIFSLDKNLFENSEIRVEFIDLKEIESNYKQSTIRRKALFKNSATDHGFTVIIDKKANSLLASSIISAESSDKELGIDKISSIGMAEVMSDFFLAILVEILFPKVYIFPAERIALSIFSKELSIQRNILIDKLLEYKVADNASDPLDLIKRRLTRYSMPIRDNLEIVEDLVNFKKNISEYADFADEIERDIISGNILISKDGDLQFKPSRSKSLRLPLHSTATAVKSLSHLVIYLRHFAQPNDFLLIDEPELNLHPDNQLLITKLIVKLVNKGFKVLLSTHSDYIIREINNMIMAYEQPVIADKLGYTPETRISKDLVGAYLFSYKPRKTSRIEVDVEGFGIQSIDDTITKLNFASEQFIFGE